MHSRLGEIRRGVAALTFAVLLGLATVTASSEAADDDAPTDAGAYLGPSPEAMQEPAVQDRLADSLAELEQARAQRQDSAEIDARQDSRTAYQDLSDSQARALAEEAFPELFSQPTWVGFEPPADQRVVQYYGDTAAVLEHRGDGISAADAPNVTTGDEPVLPEPGAVVQSILPIRAETEAGQLRPIDSDLVAQGDHLEAANPSVEAQLPVDIADGIDLPEAELNLEPAHAAEADAAEVVGPDKVFYANIDVDTDFFASPTQLGVESFWQLRSERSPEQLSLDLDLPEQAELEPTAHGLGAEVTGADGETLATVQPAQAFDADGTSVPLTMTTEGEKLRLSVAHQSEDWKYPIQVDPIAEAYYWPWGTPCPAGSYNVPRWGWVETLNAPFSHGCSAAEGLVNFAPGWNYYGQNWYSQWVWTPPANTYIERADLTGVSLAHNAGENVCTWGGIWSNSAWQWQSAVNFCSTFSGANWIFPVGTGGHDNNVAVLQLYMPGSNPRFYNSWTGMTGGQFWVSDRHPPTFAAGSPGDSPWTDDSLAGGGTTTYSPTLSATDVGFGVKHFWLLSPKPSNPGENNVAVATRNCGGGLTDCVNPLSWSANLSYQLPEGRNRITSYAFDQIANAGSHAWWQPIDRSAPVVDAPTGSLVTNKNNILPNQSYELKVSASDGSTATAGQMRSGVTKIDIYVDGEDEPRQTWTQNCTAPEGSCRMPQSGQLTWTILPGEFDEGAHELTVVATDARNHESQPNATSTVTIQAQGDTQEPLINAQIVPNGTGEAIQVTATDPPPGASGVSHLEAWVDDEKIGDETVPCPSGGCQMSALFPIPAGKSSATSQIDLYSDDQAGNSASARWGFRKTFERIGFNDDFGVQLAGSQAAADAAVAQVLPTGSNTLRFYLDTCLLNLWDANPNNHDANPNNDSNELNRYWRIFNAISATNRGLVGDHRLRVIGIVLQTAACRPDPNGPPSESPNQDQLWKDAVGSILAKWGPTTTDPGDPLDPNDDVDYGLRTLEMWNEPNNPSQWDAGPLASFHPDPSRFAQLVNMGGKVVHDYNDAHSGPPDLPDVRVLSGAVLPLLSIPKGAIPAAQDAHQDRYVKLAYGTTPSNGATINPDRIDAIAIHLYANQSKNMGDVRNRILTREYDAVRADFPPGAQGDDFRDMDIWVTEIGFASQRVKDGSKFVTRGSANMQSERLAQMFDRLAPKGRVKSFIVHRLIDPPVSSNPTELENGAFGLLTQTCTRHQPGYERFAKQVMNSTTVPPNPGVCP